MNEENKFENEETTEEVVEETVEEVAEEAVEEVTEDAVEEVIEDTEETAENAETFADYSDELPEDAEDAAYIGAAEGDIVFDEEALAEMEALDGVKSSKKAGIIALSAVAVLVVAAIAVLYFMGYFGIWFNKYNKQYIDTTGRTIEEVAEMSGMTVKEFLEEYDLPKNMPKNTYESAAFYTMPGEKAAEVYGMTFDDMKKQLQLPEDADPKAPWGEIEGEVTLSVYVGGDEYVDQIKEIYGLGDEVTGETKWKEIRPVIDAKQKEQREESERLAAEAEAKQNEESGDTAEDGEAEDEAAESTEAPAAE